MLRDLQNLIAEYRRTREDRAYRRRSRRYWRRRHRREARLRAVQARQGR